MIRNVKIMKKSSKILIYGLLVSILLIASCLYMEKIKFMDGEEAESIKKEQELSIASVLGENNKKSEQQSTLEYKIEKGVISIDGRMPLLENSDPLKKSMMQMCGVLHCDRKITFSPDMQNPEWKALASETIDLFHQENLSSALFSVSKESKVSVGGEFLSKISKDRLSGLLEKYKQYSIEDSTTLKVLNKIVKSKSPNNDKKISSDINTTKETKGEIEIAQVEIEEILKNKRINFIRNRAKIRKRALETLNEIIVILKKVPDAKIEVRGYTDASGKRAINKWISEERAKSVRNYLGSHGINPINIEAKGFGEEDLLYADKPYSKLNRRVEIGIKRR